MIRNQHAALKLGTILCAMLFGSTALADGVTLQFNHGVQGLRVKSGLAFETGETEDSLEWTVGVGYRMADHLLFSVTHTFGTELDIWGVTEDYDLTEWRAAIGWEHKFSPTACLEPSIGMSWWKLESEESPFLNPGDEETWETSDNNLFWQLKLIVGCHRPLQTYFGYMRSDYEFGKAEYTSVGLRFNF